MPLPPHLPIHAIIVAGGSGSRMKSDVPKQFLVLAGRPVLMHTLNAFYTYNPGMALTVVLPEAHIPTWQSLCKEYSFEIKHSRVAGGSSRRASVYAGLLSIENTADGLVAIHDGVRPFCNVELLQRGFDEAAKTGCAVAAVELKDSIREVTPRGNRTADRTVFRQIQTPQIFDLKKLTEAHGLAAEAGDSEFTDDAAVWEHAGHPVHLFEGSYRNIKITTAEDLAIGEALLGYLKH